MDNLHSKVIIVINEYLGPASERFINRLIEFHLNKKPADLVKSDLPELTEWVKISLGVLTNDAKLVEDCTKKLHKLSV